MPSRSEKEKSLRQAEGFAGLGFLGAVIFFSIALLLYFISSFFWGIVFAILACICGNNGFKHLLEVAEIKKTLDNFTFSPPCILTVGDAIITYKYLIPSDTDPDDSLSVFPSQQDADQAILKIWCTDPNVPLSKYEDILKIKIVGIHKKPVPPPPPPPELPPPQKLGKGFVT